VSPYERIAELAELQLAAVTEGRLEELDKLQAEQAELAASLPSTAPADACPALERAAELNQRARAITEGEMGALAAELGRLRQGSTAIAAYAAAARTA
jgi:hypothetical protein